MTSDAAPGYLSADDCRLADLIDLVSQKTDLADYPYAVAVEQNMLIYDGARLRKQLCGPAGRLQVEAELARALLDGPGIMVLAGAFDDLWVVDRATRQFEAIIAAQRTAGGAAGDPFAAAGRTTGSGTRWRSWPWRAGGVRGLLPNNLIAAVCRAWLGPGYQVTSQVNVLANLHFNQPIDGLAPPTQATSSAMAEGWSRQQLQTELVAWSTRRSS